MYTKNSQLNKKRKNSKSRRKSLIKQLDSLCREYLLMGELVCCCCGKKLEPETAQVSHYISRRFYAVRWDLNNIKLSCAGCNIQHNVNPLPYTQYLLRNGGQKLLDYLENKKNSGKLKLSDMESIKETFEGLTCGEYIR